MTRDEFVRWATDDGVVRFKDTKMDFILVKRPGDTSAPLATLEQYENFEVSFAHAFADGPVKRYGMRIADLSDLTPVRVIESECG